MELPPTEGGEQPDSQPALYQEALVELGANHEAERDAPRLYLCDTTGLAKNVTRGRWVDATDDPEQLQAVHDELLHMSPFPNPDVTICWLANFEGLQLDEHEDLATVSRLARGVAAHGRAFVAYVEAWGRDQAAVDEFSRYYLGTWPDTTAWAEYMSSELDWPQQLDERLDEHLRQFVRIDYERMGRDLSYGAYVVDDPERSQIHIFRLSL